MKYTVDVHRIAKQSKDDGEYIDQHTHPFFHYTYVLSGVGLIKIADYQIEAKQRTLAMVPPETMHAIYGIDKLSTMEIKFSCNPNLTLLTSNFGYCIQEVNGYEDFLIKDVFSEAIKNRNHFEQMINVRILELLIRIARRQKSGIYMTVPDDMEHDLFALQDIAKPGQILEIIRYIDCNIDQPLRVSELAAEFGYSENYFSAMFKKVVNCSPTHYIAIKRVEKAKVMLLSSSMSVTEVSQHLGYDNLHYFSRVFKKITGISPINYSSRYTVHKAINILPNSVYTPKTDHEIPIKRAIPDFDERLLKN